MARMHAESLVSRTAVVPSNKDGKALMDRLREFYEDYSDDLGEVRAQRLASIIDHATALCSAGVALDVKRALRDARAALGEVEGVNGYLPLDIPRLKQLLRGVVCTLRGDENGSSTGPVSPVTDGDDSENDAQVPARLDKPWYERELEKPEPTPHPEARLRHALEAVRVKEGSDSPAPFGDLVGSMPGAVRQTTRSDGGDVSEREALESAFKEHADKESEGEDSSADFLDFSAGWNAVVARPSRG